MTLDVLLSCMNQKDISIVEKSNIQSDIVVINQCEKASLSTPSFVNALGQDCHITFVSTTQRGLSNSRNLAIHYSKADICLIADDDEFLAIDYVQKITSAFERNPKADVIAFQLEWNNRQYKSSPCQLGYLGVLNVCSWQIAFRRKSICRKSIQFDSLMGSGTGNGAGEENKFLYDCLRAGLKVYYEPVMIGRLVDNSESQWFKGFTPTFFINRGWATRRYMGMLPSTLYAFYYTMRKYNMYKSDISFFSALSNSLKGIFLHKVAEK